MKKWLYVLGISGSLILTGCNGNAEDTNAETENQAEEKTEEVNEQQVKKEILKAQMELTNTFKPYQEKITAYQAAVSAEEPDSETIQSTGKEAKTAASEAASKVEDFTIEADLPEDVNTAFNDSLPSLQAYYEHVESALNENLEEADFTSAEEKFTEFNNQFNEIIEKAGFPAAPDLMEEMS
ncbi:hypothetical protein SAMN05192559_104224 [Halobacillus karajensis]|uniref:hypothetical protein n=1 Tax=Halobacillus karajensis TaxID=195088 RepID=UPI0008A7D344|nr:hypothetical protein [Halobacillus karajensis]SEH80435.1 hypothetical protein SAMN05192559_104224 [Halobacillus karajensis]